MSKRPTTEETMIWCVKADLLPELEDRADEARRRVELHDDLVTIIYRLTMVHATAFAGEYGSGNVVLAPPADLLRRALEVVKDEAKEDYAT